MTPAQAIKMKSLAAELKVVPAWRAFKAKWDGKMPRLNSKKFDEYARDLETAKADMSPVLAKYGISWFV